MLTRSTEETKVIIVIVYCNVDVLLFFQVRQVTTPIMCTSASKKFKNKVSVIVSIMLLPCYSSRSCYSNGQGQSTGQPCRN